MLGTAKTNLFTFVVLQCEFFSNSVEQPVFICSEEIQLCDSSEKIRLLQLFGGTLQCSGGEATSPTLQQRATFAVHQQAFLYNATVNMCNE